MSADATRASGSSNGVRRIKAGKRGMDAAADQERDGEVAVAGELGVVPP